MNLTSIEDTHKPQWNNCLIENYCLSAYNCLGNPEKMTINTTSIDRSRMVERQTRNEYF